MIRGKIPLQVLFAEGIHRLSQTRLWLIDYENQSRKRKTSLVQDGL